MTLANPMDIRKPKRCNAANDHEQQKRNSWDVNSLLINGSKAPTPFQNSLTMAKKAGNISSSAGDISLRKSPVSQSIGDIQIIQSPPTPEHSVSSSTSDVLTSVNTSIGDISIRSAPTPPLHASGLTSQNSSPTSSMECSPEIRRKLWHSKILNIKDDLEKVCYKVKHAKDTFRDSMDEWRAKRAGKSGARSKSGDSETRIIKVEYVEMQRPHRQRTMHKHQKHISKKEMEDEDELDIPDHNISPALILTSLQDCMFTAEVSMVNLPDGDITLRISGYRVMIIINRKKSKSVDDSHRIIKPFKYGEIDIPIYVDPATLCFQYEEQFNTLRLQAKMKGHESKKYSLSNDDLRVMKSSPSKTTTNSGKQRLKLSKYGSSKEDNLSDTRSTASDVSPMSSRKPGIAGLSSKSVIDIESFRDRAYTK